MKGTIVNYIPLDRDFIQTIENFFFCIIGYEHPPERILGYLKYIPADFGKWKLGNQNLKRVIPYYSAESVINTFQFLKEKYPQYLFYDNYSEMTFSAVPITYIKKYYSSQKKLEEIFELKELDLLQKKLKSFILRLSNETNVPINAFGVTGSILLNIHNPKFSDLDITVHGYDNAIQIKRALQDIFKCGDAEITPLSDIEADRWKKDKVKRFRLKHSEIELLFRRKWNMGIFQKTRFSVHPIRNRDEIYEHYGDKSYKSIGQIEIYAKIMDNSQAMFLPSKYQISNVRIIKGKKVENIIEIISYEGLFDAVAEKNEIIKAKGQLELVTDNRTQKKYYRIVIGSRKGKSKEFLSLLI